MAARLASLPSTILSASSRCQSRLIPGLDGNSVLIDTPLHSFSLKHLGYRTKRRVVKYEEPATPYHFRGTAAGIMRAGRFFFRLEESGGDWVKRMIAAAAI